MTETPGLGFPVEEGMQRMRDLIQKSTGVRRKRKFKAMLGIVRVPRLHLLMVEATRSLGVLGNSNVHGIGETTLVRISNKVFFRPISGVQLEMMLCDQELSSKQSTKLMSLLASIEFEKDFFFSFCYDLTRSLQVKAFGLSTWPSAMPIFCVIDFLINDLQNNYDCGCALCSDGESDQDFYDDQFTVINILPIHTKVQPLISQKNSGA